MDYILNVCKFLENMLSNNNTADHCRVFIKEGGLQVLIQLISLRALPIDFATSTAAAQIAAVLRIILVLSKETTVLEETLKEVLICAECDKEYVSEANYRKHMKLHQREFKKTQGDNQSSKVVSKKRKVQKPKRYEDEENAISEYYEDEVNAELQRKRKKTAFKCDTCEKYFSSKQCLDNHGKIHSNDRPFSCEKCRPILQGSRFHGKWTYGYR